MLSETTNSEIGSTHWFMTLTSNLMNIGLHMVNLPMTAEQQIDYGHTLYQNAEELRDNYSKINLNKEELQKLINKLQEDLNKL